MSEGVKFDGEKPWAGTVLAGHWPELFHSAMDVLGVARWELEVLGELFDSSVPYQARLSSAANELTRKHHKDWLPFVVEVGNFGAHKPEYGPDNWLSLKNGSRRCYEAAGRHVMDWFCGASTDAHSGFHQRGHIWWNILSGSVHAKREAQAPELKEGQIVAYARPPHVPFGVISECGGGVRIPTVPTVAFGRGD
jgi:hypothetical protein